MQAPQRALWSKAGACDDRSRRRKSSHSRPFASRDFANAIAQHAKAGHLEDALVAVL